MTLRPDTREWHEAITSPFGILDAVAHVVESRMGIPAWRYMHVVKCTTSDLQMLEMELRRHGMRPSMLHDYGPFVGMRALFRVSISAGSEPMAVTIEILEWQVESAFRGVSHVLESFRSDRGKVAP